MSNNKIIQRVKELFLSFHNYVNGLKTIKFIFVMACVSLSISVLLAPLQFIIPGLNNYDQVFPDRYDYLYIYINGVLLIPLYETITGQFLPITIMRYIKWIKEYKSLHVFLSALFFGIGHYNYGGIGKVMGTFVAGLVFSYAYVLYANKKKKPILVTYAIHALHNFVAFLPFIFVS